MRHPESARLIRAAVKQTGLSRRKIAYAAGVSEVTIHNWLTGWNVPREENLTKLASVLGVPVESLSPQ